MFTAMCHKEQQTSDNLIVKDYYFITKIFDFWTCEANTVGENSSFIFTVCVRSVPRNHFKLAYVVLQMTVKEYFETHF